MKKSEKNPKSKKLHNCEQAFVQVFVPRATRGQLGGIKAWLLTWALKFPIFQKF